VLVKPYQTFVRQDPPQAGKLALDRSFINSLLGGSETVISRRLCSFNSRVFANGRIGRDLINAVILEAAGQADRPNPGLFLQVDGRVVNCWTWDSEQIEALSGTPARHAVPETLYHPAADGAVLRQCLEGCEGQMWSGGVLRVSRWWAQPPGPEDWAHFCRAAGQGDPSGIPKMDHGYDPKVSRPRNRLTAPNLLRQVSPKEYLVAAAALAALPALYFGVRNLAVQADLARTASVHAELTAQTREKRAIVSELTRVNTELAAIREAMVVSAPLPAVAEAMKAVDAIGGTTEVVNLSGDEVNLTFSSAGPFSERGLVEALEAAPGLRQASVSQQGQSSRWVVDVRLERDG